MTNVTVSPDFKRKAARAILSIVLFTVTYLLLFAMAVALTILCGYGGLMLLAARPSFVTLMLGLGIAAMGALTLFFLIKFIFTKNRADLSHFVEVTETGQPQLFSMIRNIVDEAGTDFPKKVYLSSEVNASVFYNSSFWSMFLPVRKNLHIGLGLVNAVTVDELRSVIAHEFGHFSQRSMKVGSYVYNVNYVIHNMLYDNDDYNAFVGRIARFNGWVSLPVAGSVKIVEGIQWVLQKVHMLVNSSYRALSREMEFHADEVAARIAGPQAIATSLPRMEIADNAYHEVIGFYSRKVSENIRPDGILAQQLYVMQRQANKHGIALINGLPQVSEAAGTRLVRSRLKVDDAWATHPDSEDRIARVKALELPAGPIDSTPAITLIAHRELTEKQVLDKLFDGTNWKVPVTGHSPEQFIEEFEAEESKTAFPDVYNGYYDDIVLPEMDIAALRSQSANPVVADSKELFIDQKVELIYERMSLEQDLEALNAIATGTYPLKTFAYSGQRYDAPDAGSLIVEVAGELERIAIEIEQNNAEIYRCYYNLSVQKGAGESYLATYARYRDYMTQYEEFLAELDMMYKRLNFMSEVTPHETILANLQNIAPDENRLKESMTRFINNENYKAALDADAVARLEEYIASSFRYFNGSEYNDYETGMMYASLKAYNYLLNLIVLYYKKDFLNYQASLTN